MDVEVQRLKKLQNGMEWKDMVWRLQDVHRDLLQPPSALVFISAERLKKRRHVAAAWWGTRLGEYISC